MNVSRPFVPSLRPVILRPVPLRPAPLGAGLLPCLPFIALFIVVIAALAARIAPPLALSTQEERPFAQGMTRHDALRSAERLCTRLAKAPAEAVAVHPVSTPNGDHAGAHHEWQIVCRAAAEEYFVRLDGGQDNLISVQRETISRPASARSNNNDAAEKSVCIDRDAALILSKRYLVVSGLASRMERVTPETLILQDKGRNAWDGYFRCETADGYVRRVRIGISALSGGLNRIQRLGLISPH